MFANMIVFIQLSDLSLLQFWWLLPFGLLCGLVGWLIHKTKARTKLEKYSEALESEKKAHSELVHKFDILTQSSQRQINGLLAEIKSLGKGLDHTTMEEGEPHESVDSPEVQPLATVSSITKNTSPELSKNLPIELKDRSQEDLIEEINRLKISHQKLSKVPQALYLEKIKSLKKAHKGIKEKRNKLKKRILDQEHIIASYEAKIAKLQQKIRSLREKNS